VSRRRALLLGLLLLGFGLVLLAVETRWGPIARFDHRVAGSLYRHGRQHPSETAFWRVVSDVLHPDVLRIVAAVVAIAFWWRRRLGAAFLVVVAMTGQALLETITKTAVDRARPMFAQPLLHASGASFPSGHAMTSFVAFGVLVLLVPPPLLRRAAFAVGVVAVALVAYSRLALAVHYPTDIAGAWLLGGAWLVAAEWLTYALRAGRATRDRPRGR
jgi:undecaprenyl-diphosphatase